MMFQCERCGCWSNEEKDVCWSCQANLDKIKFQGSGEGNE